MAELTKLQSDEELWNQALAEADQLEQEIYSQEKHFMEKEEQRILDQERSNALMVQTNQPDTNRKIAMKTEISNITQCIRDMNLSITQIEQGLQIIGGVVMEAETTRKDLYNEFTQHHQFRGYQGIHNSKGLILALSQSQDDSAW
jgi:spore germination protein YaaH